MKRLTSPWLWLMPVAVLLTASPVRAEPIPLKELDQETVQARARHYLRQSSSEARLSPVLALARVEAEQIHYLSRGGLPARLVWLYQPKTALTAVQRAVVECGLEGALAEVLAEYRGGLLAPNEARAVLGLVRICDATQRPPADLAA
jgi:hypothetical protein